MDHDRPANPYLPPMSELNQGVVAAGDGVYFCRENRRCLHNHIAGTRVVRTER